MLLQEYIPGPPTAHVFLDGYVDRTGVMRGCLARRRLRMYPPEFGNSTMSATMPLREAEPALESLSRLLAGLGYTGLFDAEFKYDERDGLFKVLEVNARPWWQLEIAAASGLDLCMMAYRDALGLPLAAGAGLPDRAHLGPPGARPARLVGGQAHRQRPASPPRAFFGGANAILSRDDPMPVTDELGRHLRDALGASAGRLRERLGRRDRPRRAGTRPAEAPAEAPPTPADLRRAGYRRPELSKPPVTGAVERTPDRRHDRG